MGCVSSTLLNQDDEFSQIGGSSAFSHHIVSLTSTTYGLLTLDYPPTTTDAVPPILIPSSRRALDSDRSLRYQPPLETINSWDLMSGLDSDHIPSFRILSSVTGKDNDENVSPNLCCQSAGKELNIFVRRGFEMMCPPNGENKVVIYTTTLRGVRKTFEDCNAVRSVFRSVGKLFSERDVSMDRGFKDELRELLNGKNRDELIPPRVFVKGWYIGGVEEVMRIVEEGYISDLLDGLPKSKGGYDACGGCGSVGFLPCFTCNGSCKNVKKEPSGMKHGKSVVVVVRCSECNENGLVLCPVCSSGL